jgi:glycosyltransferase involved in cell wall biosynthesis
MPKVSVIIPVFNGSRTIERCVNSLKAQTLKQCEFIFVDDGSTDGTMEHLNKLTFGDSRFIMLQMGKRTDPFQARKMGIAKATGKYIMFLDADDTFISKACEKAYKKITRKNVDLFLFGSKPISISGINKDVLKKYAKYLKFENKIRGIYRSQQECHALYFKDNGFGFTTSLAKKIFKADLLKQAMNKLNPEQYLGYGQDLYQLIATMPYINSIYADNRFVLHNYFIGDGVTQLSQSSMPIEKYKRIISSANTYHTLKGFLQTADLSESNKLNALKNAKKSLLTSAQKHLWYLNDLDLSEGINLLKTAWKNDYLEQFQINDNASRADAFILNNKDVAEETKIELKNYLAALPTNLTPLPSANNEASHKILAWFTSLFK